MAQDTVHIVGLGGSYADDSTSLAALRVALEGASEAGARVELFDIHEMELPFYVPGMEPPPVAVRLAEAVSQAHGMIWSSPLYHGSVSGAFKNAIDWLDLLRSCDPPFLTDKMIGLMSTAGGMQGLQAVNSMEFMVRALRGWAVPFVMPIGQAWKAFDASGRFRDPQMGEQVRMLGKEVVRAAQQFAAQGFCEYTGPAR
jgi:FMN reductase